MENLDIQKIVLVAKELRNKEMARLIKKAANYLNCKRKTFVRFNDQWVDSIHAISHEKYLSHAQDVYDLERRQKFLDRNRGFVYY